jgi:lipoprotein-releasing system permease protein
MFQPLECYIGLRYLRSRRRRGVASFMSTVSLLGIALGVAALIVILSVMNGFETELRTRLLSMSAHLTVVDPGSGVTAWRELAAVLTATPEVVGAAPYVSLEGMLTAGPNLNPALVRGILPEAEREVSDVARFVDAAELAKLTPNSHHIVLGRILASSLGVEVGQRINLLVPRIENGRLIPQFQSFTVVGIFAAGIVDHDANLALVHLSDASQLKRFGGRPEGVAVRLRDPMVAQAFHRRAASLLGDRYRYSDWTEQHAGIFGAIRLEKIMMSIILMSIVGVAAFNIVASLMMVVTDKERDIAILRTYGLEPARVARVFLVQGSIIGLFGTLFGTALGLVLAFNVGTIVPWMESTFGFQIMPGDVYYVTEIPSEIHAQDVILMPVLALCIAVAATIYPSRRAASVAPAQALRYE